MLRHIIARRSLSALIANPPLFTPSIISSNTATASYSTSTPTCLPSSSLSQSKCPLGHSTMTKIVCTLGPSSDTAAPIGSLVSHGMHVARLNFSHAGDDYTYPFTLLQLVRSSPGMHSTLTAGAASDVKLPPNLRAILVDTKGPEIRTGPLQGNVDVLELEAGSLVELTNENVSEETPPSTTKNSENNSDDEKSEPVTHRIQVDYESMSSTLNIGNSVLLDDGLIELQVTHVDGASKTVTCVVCNSGPIKRNKGVNLPNVPLDLPALTEKDKRDLKWACEVGADYVAASFIRTPGNVRSVVAYLDRCIAEITSQRAKEGGLDKTTPILRPLVISKIESKEGVDNFAGILAESDGIMVARGDLGVEIRYSEVFAAQKMMVRECNAAGKPVIVATQMLDSMRVNPRPTRAEVTDVGTAVLDGADAIMLSGETAAGKYPLQSLKAMTSVATEADRIYDDDRTILSDEDGQLGLRRKDMSLLDAELDSVAESAVRSARDMNAQMIILITKSGLVAKGVARHRPTVPVLAFCTDVQVARRLQLHRSLTPVLLQTKYNPYDPNARMGLMRAEAIRTAKELGFLKPGDRFVTVDRTRGRTHDMHAYSHNMKVATLRET